MEDKLKTIRKAAENKKVLRVSYTDRKDDDSIRNIEPYEMRGDHLFAYCRKRKGIRRFDINKIGSLKETQYTFMPKYPIKMSDSLEKKASTIYDYMIGNYCFGDYESATLE